MCTKTLKVIEQVCNAKSENRILTVSDIQRITGKLISLRLAIPSISVWLREVYFCLPEEGNEDDEVEISQRAIDSLEVITSMILRNPSSPFISPSVERDMYVDSGECGWGATVLGIEAWGSFDSEIIGQSSTFREIQGLILALSDTRIRGLISNHVVRFNMDSKAAIANLLHSGPVRTLTPLTQQVWKLFTTLNITPSFRWIPRSTDEISRVDILSKLVTFSLKPEAVVIFQRRLES